MANPLLQMRLPQPLMDRIEAAAREACAAGDWVTLQDVARRSLERAFPQKQQRARRPAKRRRS